MPVALLMRFVLSTGSVLALLALFLVPTVAPRLVIAEHLVADWRTALFSEQLVSTHPKFVIVTITEQTTRDLPYILPFNRGQIIAEIVAAADRAGARAIGLDFYFARDTKKEDDDKLLETLQRAREKVVLGIFEDPHMEAQLAYQYHFIAQSGAAVGYLDLAPDPDGVIRHRTPPRSAARYRDSFSTQLSKSLGWRGGVVPSRIGWLLPPSDGRPTFLKIEADKLFEASAEERVALVKDRVVLIGGELFSLDRHFTPISLYIRRGLLGTEIHAHMAAELADGGRSYAELNQPNTSRFLAGLALLAVVLGFRLRFRGWLVASLGVLVLDILMFRILHFILPFTLGAVAWIGGVTAGAQLRRAIILRGSR